MYISVDLTVMESGSTLGTEMVQEFRPTEKQQDCFLDTTLTNSELLNEQ